MTSDEPEPAEATTVGVGPEADADVVIPPIEVLADAPAEVASDVPAPAFEVLATDGPEVAAAVGDEPGLGAAIAGLGESLGRRLDALASAFDREFRAESTREKVVDRLHAELQEYKNDLLLNVLRPVFVDLIQLHDDIGKIVASTADPEGEAARLLDMMRGFQQGVEDILYRQGVERFLADDDAFDPRRQRAGSTVPTDDPALNKRVAARLRPGFRSADKVIRPEVVSVYALKR